MVCPTSAFNVIDSLIPGFGRIYQGKTLTGAREHFEQDARPATTIDSYKPRFGGMVWYGRL